MRAFVVLGVLAACGDSGGGGLRVTTSYTITDVSGTGPSSLDVLNGQLITLDVELDGAAVFRAESVGCTSTIFSKVEPKRTAGGPQAALVQSQILDVIPVWEVELELCEAAASSRIAIDASINELNTTIGCLMLPASAIVRGGDGYPVLTTFVGAGCSTTILDVVNNRVLGATGFTVSFDTDGKRLQ
jgi:hypothetical protein